MTGEQRRRTLGQWARKKYPTICEKYSAKISIFIENIPAEMTLNEAKGQIEKMFIEIINKEERKGIK